MILPINGEYLTSQDFPEWSSHYSEVLKPYGQPLENEKDKENNLNGIRVKTITFILTQECNLRCTYCYLKTKSNKRMSKETAKKAVDFLLDKEKLNGYIDAEKTPGIILEFIGGEPLMAIDMIDYVVDYFLVKAFKVNHPWAKNYMISLSSNGILYNSEKFQDFLDKHPGKTSIGISVDGNKKLHDSCRVFPDGSPSYDIVINNVKKWMEKEQKPSTKLTLAPQNINYLFEAIENLKEVGYIGVNANAIFEKGWKTRHAVIFYEQLKKIADWTLKNKYYKSFYISLFDELLGSKALDIDQNYCGGDGNMLAIDIDGNCYPCVRFAPYALSHPERKAIPIGNVYEGLDSPENNKFLKHLKSVTIRTQSNEKCLNCPISQGCALCTGYQFDEFGDPNIRATFICEMHQARVLANHYYWNKLYKKLKIDKQKELKIPQDWAFKIIDKKEYNMLLSW